MLHRREFAFLLLFAAAVLLAFLWPAERPGTRSSLPATAGIENADPDTDITGVVVDSWGRRVAGALITSDIHTFGRAPLYSPDWTRPEVEGPTTVTARDGTFVLDVGHGEIVDLCVRPQKHGEAMTSWRRPGDHLEIVVTDGADVRVKVFDGDGKPATDVRVFIQSLQGFEHFVHWHSGVTDGDGVYSYPRLSAGVIGVRAEADGEAAMSGGKIPASGAVDLTLRLGTIRPSGGRTSATRRAEGVVFGPDGSPLAGVRVATPCETTWTDAAGEFRIGFDDFEGLAIWSPGLGRIIEETGAWKGVREFRLVHGRTLSGRVSNEYGHPVPDAVVHLFPGSGTGAELARTDAKGYYRFPDLVPGTYGLLLSPHSGGPDSRKIVVPDSDDVTGIALRQSR